ncbi:MAG TPA: hypothetical protein VGG01_15940 [Xanthobacteraceae bacterium]
MQRRLGGIMPGDSIDRTRGGYQRVARYFLPPCPAANLIRLAAYDPRRALSRRRLARLIDPRRVVS